MTVQPRIKDLGRWYSGGTPPKSDVAAWAGSLPWLSAKDINAETLRDPTMFITEAAAREHSRIVDAPAILVIVRGMALAHGLPVVLTDRRVAFNQDLRALVPRPTHSPRFLYYAFRGHRHQFGAHIDRAAHGTARVIDSFYGERIYAPELTDQRRVAEFLDDETARIIELRANLRALRERLVRYARERVLDEIARVHREQSFTQLKRLTRLPLVAGLNEPASDGSADWPRYIRTTDICGLFELSEDAVTLPPDVAAAALVQQGDILMTRTGSLGTVYAHRTDDAACYAGYLVRARIDPSEADWRFVAYVLDSSMTRDQIAAGAIRSTIDNFNATKIGNIRMPKLPLTEQVRIADALDDQRSSSRAAVSQIQRLEKRLVDYHNALIAEAVTGELDVRRARGSYVDERVHAALEGVGP